MTNITTTTTTTTTTKVDEFLINQGELSSSQSVGDFITDVRFLPYLRSKEIKIYVTGLKPDTRHYFFFDDTNINAHVAPGKVYDSNNPTRSIERSGTFGSEVRTDSNGILVATFLIPENTFYVGSNTLQVCDVSNLSNVNVTSSKAKSVYKGFNFSVEKQQLTIATREPEFSVDSSTTVNVNRVVTTTSGRTGSRNGKPF